MDKCLSIEKYFNKSGLRTMKLELHHINLSTQDVKKLQTFYKDILFLDTQRKKGTQVMYHLWVMVRFKCIWHKKTYP